MSNKNTNLLEIIRKIESHHICLPSIQRKFEWKPDRIEKLFDSILNDYPIGTFLIWEIQQEKVDNFRFYEINNDYDFDDGKWQKQRTHATALPEIWALLDGQQRLTSISIGLQGSYTHSSRGKKIKRKLYFSLFDRSEENDYRSFRFFAEGDHLKDKNNIWIPASLFINRLAAFHEKLPENIEDYLPIENLITECIDRKSDAIKSLWEGWIAKNEYFRIGIRIHQFAQKIAKPGAFSYYLISNNIDLDICNEIFVRINSGGVKLSKADLLFSTVVSEWETGREQIDELIKEVKKIGFEINSDFVMRTCLYLTYSPILFKVDAFIGNTIPKIISSFNSAEGKPGIYDTVIKTFQFLKMKLGLTDKMLKSTNVVIPVIHHLYHKGKLGDESVEEVQKFIYISLLQKTFGSHGDTLLGDLRKGVSAADDSFQLIGSEFSYAMIISKITEDTKRYLYNVNVAWAEKLLTSKYGADAWLILSLIFGSRLRYDLQSYDQDHLHPKSKFTRENYPGDLKAIADKIDAIPNLTFSTPDENRFEKKAHTLKAYVDEILPVKKPEWLAQYRIFNIIDEESQLELTNFLDFFETRRQKMLKILVDKLYLNANAPESEPDTNPEDLYIDEPDEMLEAVEETAPIEDTIPVEELEEDFTETTENLPPPAGFIEAENEKAKKLSEELEGILHQLPAREFKTGEIYEALQRSYPHLCNDSYFCIDNCNSGNKQPEWKHKVRGKLSGLKNRGILQYDKTNRTYILISV